MITQLWTKLFRNVVFYHYFRAKDDLLDSLADKLDSQYANAIKNMKPEMNSYEKLIQLSLVLSTQVIKKVKNIF